MTTTWCRTGHDYERHPERELVWCRRCGEAKRLDMPPVLTAAEQRGLDQLLTTIKRLAAEVSP